MRYVKCVGAILFATMAALLIGAGAAGSDGPKQTVVQADPGLPPQGEPPVQAESDEARSREQRVLRQVIFRDRQAQSAVDQAESALRSGDNSRAVGLVQQILDRRGDHFVWVERDRRLVSARRRALALLSAADGTARDLYDFAYAREAKRLLDAGKTAGDPVLISEVARRFFHTASGFEATNWLATQWLDRGEYALAARAWSLLAGDARHRSRITEMMRRKAEVAEQFAKGKEIPSPQIAEPSSTVRTADLSATDDRRTDSDELPQRPVVQDGVIQDDVTQGGATQNGVSQDAFTQVAARFEAAASRPRSSLPYMKPAWRKPLTAVKGPLIDGGVRRWEIASKREDKEAVAVQSAVVAGSAIAYRGYDGLCAVEGATGRLMWNYTSGTSFLRAWAEVAQAGPGNGDGASVNDSALDALMSGYAGNSILGTLTTDGRRIFAIDSLDIRPRSTVPAAEEPNDTRENAARFPRSANRLIALDIFSPPVDEEGSVKPVWSVGGSMGTAHWFYRMDVNDDGRVTQAEFLGSASDFHKLDRNGDGAIDKSEAENPEVKIEHHPLHGHFFLGPPLSLDGRLYAVTEYDSQLNLVALRAETGEVLWIQGIGYVDRPIDEDALRNMLACTPCYSAGVIVCPTQVGVLVGVDALDGALLWTYYYGDDDVTPSESAWSFESHRPYGNAGFANPPLIFGNRVVVLPRQSDRIHCIDLATGRKIWKQPRNDAEYVAGAADGVVMIVGERTCRGLSVADGHDRWSARTCGVCGRGLCVGTECLLPLTENRVVAIDMRTGARTGSSAPEERDGTPLTVDGKHDEIVPADCAAPAPVAEPAATASNFELMVRLAGLFERKPEAGSVAQRQLADRPGNLAVGGSFVYSVGPREIVAFPRADVLLNTVKQRLAGADRDARDLLLAADLELMLSGGPAAKAYLRQLTDGGMSQELADKRSQLMRAILYEELAANPPDPSGVLSELEQLSKTHRERGRFLQAKVAADLRRGRFNEAIDSARAFAALEIADLLPSPTDSAHLISSRSWLASIQEDLLGRLMDSGQRAIYQSNVRIAAEQQAVLKSGDRAALERFLAVYPGHAYADAVRSRLADVLANAGQLQRAELLLLQNQRRRTPETHLAAERQLIRLWDRAGMAEEAAELLCEQEHPQLEVLSPGSLARVAYLRLRDSEKLSGRVRITQTLWEHCDNELADTYANASRAFVTRPMSPFQLIDRSSSSIADITILDRLSGTVIDTLRLPTPYTGSAMATFSQVGHFLPLGSRGSLHGVSLMEHARQKPVWTTSPASIALDVDQALVGPSGPSFCVFQSHSHLFVVDPGTGKILWQRTDLDPQSGLGGDSIRGIFGDDHVLVVLAPDHLGYTLYRTATGEEIRHGRLDNESRQSQDRRTFGCCLAYVTADETNHRLRIWNPVTDRLIYDRPISDRILWRETGEDEIAVVLADGTLQIVDGHTGHAHVSIALSPQVVQNAFQLLVYRDSDRYYVNLQPVQSPPEPRYYNYFFGTDTVLPRVDLRGDVFAIDRRSGRLAWNRSFLQRTVLRTPSLHIPVLVMLSLVGDRMNGNHRSMLIEAIDARTGETLGLEDNKLANRILQLTYDHDRRRVRLWGTRSVVDLDFAKPDADAPTADARLTGQR